MKLGLCLSGGGIKGAAHIGVLKALEEEKIKVDCISGTSSGSIVAALYSMGYNSEDMLDLFKKYGKEIKKINFCIIFKLILGLIFKRKIVIDGLNKGEKLNEIIQKHAIKKNIKNISDTNIPLVIPSVNLCNGEILLFSSIKNKRKYSDDVINISNIEIGKAVEASCAYPGIFSPVDFNQKKLIDGGVRENIPWKELKEIGAKKIISISFEEEKKLKKNLSILDCITGAMGIMMYELHNYEIDGIECLIKIKTKDIWLLDTSKIDELYKIGYKTAKKEMNNIKKYLYTV